MKNLVLFLFIQLVFFSCKSKQPIENTSNFKTTQQSVIQTIDFLSSDDLNGRNTGTNGIDRAAAYIEDIFKEAGIKPYFQTYRDTFDAKGKVAYNIVGHLEGQDKNLKSEFVVIGAHYDHIGFGKAVDGDSIANGANDNAAGTTIVLELAKQLAHKKGNKRSILFALFSAEEMGLLGSDHLAKRLKEEGFNLYTMINFEMLGVPFTDRDYEVFLTGFEKSNMAEVMNGYAKTNLIGLSEVSVKYNLFRQSDNYAFYKEFKLPSHTISSCDLSNYNYYHHVDDEVDKLDTQFMADITNKLTPVIEGVINASTKEIFMNEEE